MNHDVTRLLLSGQADKRRIEKHKMFAFLSIYPLRWVVQIRKIFFFFLALDICLALAFLLSNIIFFFLVLLSRSGVDAFDELANETMIQPRLREMNHLYTGFVEQSKNN